MSRLIARMIPHLLWIDAGAGLCVGVLVLLFNPWLSRLYGLPASLLLAMGVANLAYGLYSSSLARRRTRPRSLLVLLVLANGAWASLCVVLAVRQAPTATGLGVASLLLEGVFVGGLATLEWRHRTVLLGAR